MNRKKYAKYDLIFYNREKSGACIFYREWNFFRKKSFKARIKLPFSIFYFSSIQLFTFTGFLHTYQKLYITFGWYAFQIFGKSFFVPKQSLQNSAKIRETGGYRKKCLFKKSWFEKSKSCKTPLVILILLNKFWSTIPLEKEVSFVKN